MKPLRKFPKKFPIKKIVRAGIVATGSELLLDGVPETHSLFLADQLSELGFEVVHKSVVGDDEALMADVIRRSVSRTQVVIITGGLGSTEDDVTRKVLSRVTGRRLIFQENLLEQIKKRYTDREQPMPARNARQALMPARARAIPNRIGTAPGFILHWEDSTLIALPGVGNELRAMFEETVRPYLENRFPSRLVTEGRVLRTFGLSESLVSDRLADLMIGHPQVRIGMTAKPAGVDIRIRVTGRTRQEVEGLLGEVFPEMESRLSDICYSNKGEDMEVVVGRLLSKKGCRLAVAESCTGGMIGHRLTNVPGSSEYLDRVIVCYSDQSKTDLLDIPVEVIRENGAVSAPVVGAMARGIRQNAKTDFGLAVTGIAGPGGGSPDKPVGLVFFGLDDGREIKTCFAHFHGGREEIKFRASQFALNLLRKRLL